MLWFTPQTIGGNSRPVRICSVNLFLIVILSWHSRSRPQGTFKSPLCKVDLVQVTTLFFCDWHGISSHIAAAPGGDYLWCCTLIYPPSLSVALLPREKEKAASNLKVEIWPSASLVLDGCSSLEQHAWALRGTLWWVNSYMRNFQTLNCIQGTSSNKGFSFYPQVVLRENWSLGFISWKEGLYGRAGASGSV